MGDKGLADCFSADVSAGGEAGDAIETLVAGLVFDASGEGSRVVAARLLVEGVVAGPWGGIHHQ